jgi:hypothetical protein
MNPKGINELIFKSTHNSYANDLGGLFGWGTPPGMNHPPAVQIDDFGVWGVELDVSLARINGVPTPFIGHNGEGHGTTWSCSFESALIEIHDTMAIKFRPVFLNIDLKHWWDDHFDPADKGFTDADRIKAIEDMIKKIFGNNWIYVSDFYTQYHRFPTIPELAGKLVLPWGLAETWCDECTSKEAVENSITTGKRLFDKGNDCQGGCRVFRLDQYQADWTFEFGVPPNPIIVDYSAKPPWKIKDSEGSSWVCDNGDTWRDQTVGEHGTFRFPYKTLEKAIRRAEGYTSVTHSNKDERRAGYGWTMLLKPGNYPEKIKIDIPLTLKKYEGIGGNVIIGR